MKRGLVRKVIAILQAFALAAGSLLLGGSHSVAAEPGGTASTSSSLKNPIIADHRNATLSKLKSIPSEWIDKAKSTLHIVYGHTSHGSQVTDGMTGLAKFLGSGYSWNSGGSGGALDLRNTPGSFNTDLGNSSWPSITRSYLKSNSTVNVVMWSWCGQVSGASESYINNYLKSMAQLEEEFPNVRFVYMTGHTDGTGVSGNLHIRNEQIRKYCIENNKILFDFADIESYDPDGNYYLDKAVNDGCHYDSDGNGSRDKNWAESWQNAHKLNEDWFYCTSAHSQPLTANMKAYAAWHMFARIAGWDGEAADGENPDKEDIPVKTDTQVGKGTGAYDQIQAEEYTDMFGVESESCSEGGKNVGWIQDGDYTSYSGINFGEGAESFSARVSSETNGGRIELRLDSVTGELIGTCSVSGTGGWQEWKTVTCPVTNAAGTHDLYLVYRSNNPESDYLLNINWFQFKAKDGTAEKRTEVTLANNSELYGDLPDKIGNRPVLQVSVYKNLHPSGRILYDTVEWNYDPSPDELKKPENITVRYIYGAKDIAVPSGKYNPSKGTISFAPPLSGRYAITFEHKTYADISDAYARSYIEVLASKGLYDWIDGENFNPGRNITRAEFLYLLINALDLHAQLNGNFSDVSLNDFYCEAARVALKLGISNGIGGNRLGPDQDITRQDMAALVVRALRAADRKLPQASASDLDKFDDADSVSDYAKECMAILVKSGIIQGYNNSLYPKGKLDMQQAATIIYRLYNEEFEASYGSLR